jgi:hypothetical protein
VCVPLKEGMPERSRELGRAFLHRGYPGVIKLQLQFELYDRAQGEYVPAVAIAEDYAGIGDGDNAIKWLKHAYEDHSSAIPFIGLAPEFDSIRDDSRFQYWLRVLGLPS